MDESEKNAIIDAHLENKDKQRDRDALVKILNRYGSLDYARCRSKEYVTAAIGALCDLERNPAGEALVEMAEFMTNRSM